MILVSHVCPLEPPTSIKNNRPHRTFRWCVGIPLRHTWPLVALADTRMLPARSPHHDVGRAPQAHIQHRTDTDHEGRHTQDHFLCHAYLLHPAVRNARSCTPLVVR